MLFMLCLQIMFSFDAMKINENRHEMTVISLTKVNGRKK
jgi:hypothetical protein